MTLYTMYLTCSAMTNEPGKQLHKGFYSFNLSSFLAKLHHVLIFRLRFPISLENLVSEILKFAFKWTRLLNFKICFCCLCPSLISDRTCNPSLISIFQQITSSTVAPLEIENQTAIIIVDIEETVPSAPYLQWWDAQTIVGLAIFVLCILYSRYSVFTVIYALLHFFSQIIHNFQVFYLWPLTVRLATAQTTESRSLEMCL